MSDLRNAIRKLVSRTELSQLEIMDSLDSMLSGEASEAAIASFLVALAMKGETASELQGVLKSIRQHATSITPRIETPLIDTCGTGGDSIRTFNVSTAAAIVAAAAGAKIAKHGNRSVSGICGSADFLECIGVDLNLPPSKVQDCIERVGIGFLFAPLFHPAMKNVAAARKTIGIRTVFNSVGPLCNPCTNIFGQLIGVFEPQMMDIVAEACSGHIKEAMIVHAADGFDELSNTCKNDILWLTEDGETKRICLDPKVLGMKVARPEQLIVRTKEQSIQSTLAAIYGNGPQEKIDIVVLNASAALILGRIADDFTEGVEMARRAIIDGHAQKKTVQLVKECGNIEVLNKVEKNNIREIS